MTRRVGGGKNKVWLEWEGSTDLTPGSAGKNLKDERKYRGDPENVEKRFE